MFKDISIFSMAMAIAAGVLTLPHRAPEDSSGHAAQKTLGAGPAVRASSDSEVQERAQKLIANQHRDDDALNEYERIEHHLIRTAGTNPRTVEDEVYRVVPTGSGTLKILLKANGVSVNPAEYRLQLQSWAEVLQLALNPNDSRTKAANDRFAKRQRERSDMVDAGTEAFTPKWARIETRNGKVCDIFELDPNPDFHPHSIFQEAMTHVSAQIWVDRETNQMVRGEAHILRDISFGGGILGKLYRGGSFSMDQAEVAPGVWLPTDYQYDLDGRKFLFSFGEHQSIEASHYRRVGSPKEALPIVQQELANGQDFKLDP